MNPPDQPVDPGGPDLRRVLAEVESPGFEVAFRGYDPAQVHALLDRVAVALRGAVDRPSVPDEGGRNGAGVLPELLALVSDEVQRFRDEARAEAARASTEARAAAAAVVSEAEEKAAALLAAAREAGAAAIASAEAGVAEARRVAAAVAAGATEIGEERWREPGAPGDRRLVARHDDDTQGARAWRD